MNEGDLLPFSIHCKRFKQFLRAEVVSSPDCECVYYLSQRLLIFLIFEDKMWLLTNLKSNGKSRQRIAHILLLLLAGDQNVFRAWACPLHLFVCYGCKNCNCEILKFFSYLYDFSIYSKKSNLLVGWKTATQYNCSHAIWIWTILIVKMNYQNMRSLRIDNVSQEKVYTILPPPATLTELRLFPNICDVCSCLRPALCLTRTLILINRQAFEEENQSLRWSK